MDPEKFERMMAEWADEKQRSMPELRPTREMYRILKTRRQSSWFPFMNRWATVGVAALALVVSFLVLRPQLFQSSRDAEMVEEQTSLSGEVASKESFQETRQPPPAPAEDEMLLEQGENFALEGGSPEPSTAPVAEEESAAGLGNSASDTKDEAFSLSQKGDTELGEMAVQDARQAARVMPDESPKTAPAPEPVQAPRSSSRSRMIAQESSEMDEMQDMEITSPSAAAPMVKKRELLAPKSQMLADDMEREESGVRVLGAPGKHGRNDAVPRAFELHNGIWIDREHTAEKILIPIQRHSPAFHDLLAARPELQTYTDRYYHIIINLGSHSVEISSTGKRELSSEERSALFQ